MTARRNFGGRADLIAGLAGGVFAPFASFVGGVPLWASIPGALAVFVGTRMALAPEKAVGGTDAAAYGEATSQFASEVLEAARADVARLDACVEGIRDRTARDRLAHMRDVATSVISEVERRPSRLGGVTRLLTYYLPASARLGEGLAVVERAHRADRGRIAATVSMIERLDEVFAHHADKVSLPEVDGLDVELRLLDEEIRSEEGGRHGAAEGEARR